MVQTRYKSPYSVRLFLAIWIPLWVAYVVLVVKLRLWHPATISVLVLIVVLGTLAYLFHPDLAFEVTQTTLDDGSVVPVKRPLIGFKKLSVKIGVTGGYEVRSDGWRYEPAIHEI